MKRISNAIFGGGNKLNGLIAFAVIAAIALGCTCSDKFNLDNAAANTESNSSSTSDTPFGSDTDDGDVPNDQLLNALVKETSADFAYSVSTGNFSKMYGKASADFQSTYTEQQMTDFFKDFIANKRRVLPILNKAVAMPPEFTTSPYIRNERGLSILVVDGKYDTSPIPVTFNYEYVRRDGRWKLLVLKVFIR